MFHIKRFLARAVGKGLFLLASIIGAIAMHTLNLVLLALFTLFEWGGNMQTPRSSS